MCINGIFGCVVLDDEIRYIFVFMGLDYCIKGVCVYVNVWICYCFFWSVVIDSELKIYFKVFCFGIFGVNLGLRGEGIGGYWVIVRDLFKFDFLRNLVVF